MAHYTSKWTIAFVYAFTQKWQWPQVVYVLGYSNPSFREQSNWNVPTILHVVSTKNCIVPTKDK